RRPPRKGPNAPLVRAGGAGALGVELGGAAVYHGELRQNPRLGFGGEAGVGDIPRAIALLRRGSYLWGGVATGVGWYWSM
ncbi:MAG: cobalamin biosynthesis protein, partial [Magnetococcales bacterium]|nr:cobalamin biosynthesis protein [Magnetococcales bacterium]